MILQIRNMVSDRCITMVQNELINFGLPYKAVELGAVELNDKISLKQLQSIDIALKNIGLEIIIEKKYRLVNKIKDVIDQYIGLPEGIRKPVLSEYICKKVNFDYNYMSSVFKELQGDTIEKYIVKKKIACIKEMLIHDQLSIKEISYKLHYSSIAHLLNQFKKWTGVTPTQFKKIQDRKFSTLGMCE